MVNVTFYYSKSSIVKFVKSAKRFLIPGRTMRSGTYFLLIIGPFPFPNDFGPCFIVTYLHEFLKISVKKLKTA